ncbi:hypothetical protein KSP40_PGU021857 [Platanthera guangdongensis]|uniref:Uncharacterized protein n=1 Tax=Platanthera guangdongensis TaxID=2320717 RepID=A0ABR2LSA0_9ASPA
MDGCDAASGRRQKARGGEKEVLPKMNVQPRSPSTPGSPFLPPHRNRSSPTGQLRRSPAGRMEALPARQNPPHRLRIRGLVVNSIADIHPYMLESGSAEPEAVTINSVFKLHGLPVILAGIAGGNGGGARRESARAKERVRKESAREGAATSVIRKE